MNVVHTGAFRRVIAVAVITVGCLSLPAHGQRYVPLRLVSGAMIGDSIGSSLGSLANAMREGRRISAQYEADLERARADLAAARAGSREFDDAAARLDDLIDSAALSDLGIDVGQAVSGQTNEQRDLINRVTFGRTTPLGRPPRVAREAYDLWKRGVMRDLARGDNVVGFDDLARYPEAVRDSADLYERYLRLRNWYELNTAGKAELAFPTDEAFLRFALTYFSEDPPDRIALTDAEVERLRAGLFERFGEDAVWSAVRALRSADLSSTLIVRDPEALSLSEARRSPPHSLLTLAAREADREAFAIVMLRTGGDLDRLDTGIERLEAMREQHGSRRVNEEIDRVMRAPLDGAGRLVGGRYEGREPGEHLLAALPLDPDPVLERLERLRAEREARELARREAYEQGLEAEARERAAAGAALSAEQFDAMVRATRLAGELDLGYARLLNEPGYSVNRRGVRVIAGLWNEYVLAREQGAVRQVALTINSMRNADYRRVRNRDPRLDELRKAMYQDLDVVRDHGGRHRVEDLVAFEQIQRNRLASGELAPEDALDFTVTIADARAEFEAPSGPLPDAGLGAAASGDKDAAVSGAGADGPGLVRVGQFGYTPEAVAIVDDQLDRFLEAWDLAVQLDETQSDLLNAPRLEKGLEPSESDRFRRALTRWIGMYHEIGLRRDSQPNRLDGLLRQAAQERELRERPEFARILELCDLGEHARDTTILRSLPPVGEVQAMRIAAGGLAPERALDTSSREWMERYLPRIQLFEAQVLKHEDALALDPESTRAQSRLETARRRLADLLEDFREAEQQQTPPVPVPPVTQD